MAASILRSCRQCGTYSQMHATVWSFLSAGIGRDTQHVAAACMSSGNIEKISNSKGKKDELYRQVTVEVKGHDAAIINSYQTFTMMAAEELGVHVARVYEPPRVLTRMSLMKSVFIHKKHFHQYEMRTLYRVFELKYLTGSTASTFLEYIQRNLPEGMAMKVTKYQLEKLPEHINPPETKSGSRDAIAGGSEESQSHVQGGSSNSTDVDTGSTETPLASPGTTSHTSPSPDHQH